MSDDRRYKVEMKKGTIATQLNSIVQEIFARKTVDQVTRSVNGMIDRETSKIFQRISIDIMQQDFAGIDPYIPGGGWSPYSSTQDGKHKGYRERKLEDVGHLDWFKYGKRRTKGGRVFRKDPLLMNYLGGISPSNVLSRVGRTNTKVSKDNKRITITVLPGVNVLESGMEKQFSSLITRRQLAKLKNRVGAYRSLIGPEFMFMLNDRIPEIIERSLKRF